MHLEVGTLPYYHFVYLISCGYSLKAVIYIVLDTLLYVDRDAYAMDTCDRSFWACALIQESLETRPYWPWTEYNSPGLLGSISLLVSDKNLKTWIHHLKRKVLWLQGWLSGKFPAFQVEGHESGSPTSM